MDKTSVLGKRRRPEKSYKEDDDESSDIQEVKEVKRRASDDHDNESEHKKKKALQKQDFECPRVKETKSKLPDALQGTMDSAAEQNYSNMLIDIFGKRN